IMYCIYLIYLIFSSIFLLPVLANKSITQGEKSSSPAIEARVYQAARYQRPLDDEAPSQPIVPHGPETPSAAARFFGAISGFLPSGSGGACGIVSRPPAPGPLDGVFDWFLGGSSKDKCDEKSKNKPKKGGPSREK
ncbi:hypothetical protein ABMA28_008599, partial [Loxostege sticticalis]